MRNSGEKNQVWASDGTSDPADVTQHTQINRVDENRLGYAPLTRPTPALTSEWPRLSLSEVTQIIRGVTYKKNDSSDIQKDGYLPVLRANNIQNNQLVFNDLVYVPGFLITEQQTIKNGDIVVAMSSGSRNIVGKAASAVDDWSGGFGAFCGVLRPITSIDARYVKWFTVSSEYRNKVSELAAGVNINNLKPSHFDEILIPIPPLAEQRQIAAKLDELLAQVDSIKTRLDAIPKILKRFRQSLLAAAVSGKLTEDWREEHACSSVDAFLKEIETGRNKLKSLKKLKHSFGVTNPVEPLHINLPDDWRWVSFDHISENDNNALKAGPFGSALKKSDCVESGYKVYGQEQVISEDENLITYFISEEKFSDLKSCAVKPGDILISLVGTIGKVLILSTHAEIGIINPRLVKLSLNKKISRGFIKAYLNSPLAADFYKGFSHGGTMEILNLGILRQLPIALPPLEEQTEIVRRVEQLFAYSDQIEQRVKDAQARVKHLTKSILANAFRGELTADWRAQNPDLITGENSAEGLLERIKSVKEHQKVSRKHG